MLNFCNKYCTKNSRYNWSYNQNSQVIDKANIEINSKRFAINL
ncbi:hypothetical protein VCRA2119O147_2540001 [Vibrio crassostreae]|nr:hypothetical protein VCRA2118O144_100007 [Vibrio crassostreae]CAK1716947.1 hypothetical protein VCRA2113O120_110094 [Vibrio crassostreae]CAK1749225.1 hypothetical protein VCRA2113O119_130094 [Vibrio crassostreae]CAK1751872.1 hypothetical protein VCRA2110O113_130063 [Vibrio crassostreae]CAK1766950.1 hypothetical protein VCRA2111O320_140134 [Vibrio crassostreae]